MVARREDDVLAERLERSIDECTQKKKPKTAKNMYCNKLMADNARMQENKKMLVSDCIRIMASHHAGYKALPAAEKQRGM